MDSSKFVPVANNGVSSGKQKVGGKNKKKKNYNGTKHKTYAYDFF